MKKAIIDIDGVLNYYPQTFIDFCNDKLITSSFKTLTEIKNSLSYKEYNKYKLEYRQSDYKHKCKCRDNICDVINYLKENDYLIYIVTARELFKYNQLEKTICWLKANNIQYDYIYCTLKKDFTIFEKFRYCDVIIEDNLDNIEKIYLINGKANYYHILNNDNENNKNKICKQIIDVTEIIEDLKKKEKSK